MNTDTRTDAELNRIIEEFAGWKKGHNVQWADGVVKRYDWGWTPPDYLAFTSIRYTPGKTSCVPPNYCGDLNAVHDVAMSRTQSERVHINWVLSQMLRENDAYFLDRCINATARQRAEALVRVIEEGKR